MLNISIELEPNNRIKCAKLTQTYAKLSIGIDSHFKHELYRVQICIKLNINCTEIM